MVALLTQTWLKPPKTVFSTIHWFGVVVNEKLVRSPLVLSKAAN